MLSLNAKPLKKNYWYMSSYFIRILYVLLSGIYIFFVCMICGTSDTQGTSIFFDGIQGIGLTPNNVAYTLRLHLVPEPVRIELLRSGSVQKILRSQMIQHLSIIFHF